MTPRDLIADLRSRINPAYAAQLGTESYERRLCVEALESLVAERDRLAAENAELVSALRVIADLRNMGKIEPEVVAFSALAKVKESA